jgi:hypothetical protein
MLISFFYFLLWFDSVYRHRLTKRRGKFPCHFLRAHYPATNWAILDQAFAARCFRRATFGRCHPSASAFFCHTISFLLVE